MAETVIDEERLKTLLKSAIVELLEERGDLVRQLLEGVVEDVALTHAIEEGEGTAAVSRDQIFEALGADH